MKIIDRLQRLFLAAVFVLATAGPIIAEAQPGGGRPSSLGEQVLYRFCPQGACDAINPTGGLIMDGAGNLYGAAAGGKVGCGIAVNSTCGTVFKLTPNSSGWTETVLYSFCSQNSCADGTNPFAPLIMDGFGNLYGRTAFGGSNSAGTVFKLAPSGTGWTETVLYSFCAQGGSSCTDGGGLGAAAGLIMGGSGNLYGTTIGGGMHGGGVVFQLAPNGNGWTETVLYSFCAQGGTSCADGSYPYSGLIMDGAGNLYGTTESGGSYGEGTVFKIAPSGSAWAETVLYSFCAQGGSTCTDGASPRATLILDGAGDLYGTTVQGGKYGAGAAFQLAPSGSGWAETVLYSFCAQGGISCVDGSYPYSGLIMDGAGNLYGTTESGGAHGAGTVYKLAPSSSGATETVLYSFCSQNSCADGANPYAPLMMDGAGNLYGTTLLGGNYYCGWNFASGCGTVFQLTGVGNTVSVSIVGNPGGRVTSSPAGIDCGSTCSASFAVGTQVTLSATPAAAWGLASWGGACSGIGGCSVTMNANTSVSANFTTLFGPVAAPVMRDPTDTTALPAPIIAP
jgi:uncharacterized repeat protein (TIGR03803 family)